MKRYFISGYNYIQDIVLEAGTYTFWAYIKSDFGNTFTFALANEANEWEVFDVDVQQGQWTKAHEIFTIKEKKVRLSLIYRYFDEQHPVYVLKPQLIKGNIPSDAGSSPFDIDKVTDDLHDAIGGIEDFTNEEFADRVLSSGERVSLRRDLEAVEIIFQSLKGSYDKLLVNPFITESALNNLTAKYNAVKSAKDSLFIVINSIIDGDDIVTPEEIASKDSALSSFNSALYDYNQAEKELQKVLGEDYTQKINVEKNRVDEILSDSIADPSEKQYLANLWQEIEVEYPKISAQATSYGVSKTTYDEKYNALNSILSPVLADLTISTTISGVSIRTAFSQYYDARTALQNAITDKVNQNASAAQDAADNAQETANNAQLAADGYMKARYVRDWIQGSTLSTNNVWREINVIRKDGTNIAQGKTPSSNGSFNASYPSANATDNNINTYAQIDGTTPATSNYVEIDLGQVYNDIDYIQIWHDYADGRTFYGTKTEISVDGATWTTVYDSATMGTYKETIGGKTHSQRYNRIVSEVNRSKAITDKFGTRVDGGLISTVITEYRELDSPQVTGLISGIQGTNKDLPFLVAGGTYNDALSGTAKAIIRHDGSVKFTEAEIQGQLKSNVSGSGIIIDPSDRSLKLTNDSGGVIAKLSADLSIPVLVLGDWGGASSAVHLSGDGLLVRVSGTSESDISFNKMSVFNSTGSIFEASVPYGYPLVVIMKNLPSSSTGLSTGRLWRDSNGFIRIVL